MLAIAEAVPLVVWTARADGGMDYFNQHWYGYTDLTPERSLGLGWTERLHPDDLERSMEEWATAVRTQRPAEFEIRFLRSADKQYRWHLTRAVPVRDSTGRLRGWVGMATDIHEQKEIEAALRESEERFRATFNQAAVGMAHIGLDGQWLSVNDRLLEITGYSREAMLQLTYLDVTYPEDQERTAAHIEQMLSGERVSGSVEKRYLRADGALVWVNVTRSLVRHPSGEPYYFIAVIEDIHEKKMGEYALQRAHQRLNNHMENTPLAVIEWDHAFRVIRWSPGAQRMFGWTTEEVFDKAPTEWGFIHPQDETRVLTMMRRLLSGEECRNMIHNRNIARDGQIVICDWRNSVLFDENGELISILSLAEDVTERTLTEAALRESENRFRGFFDQAAVGMILLNPSGRFLLVNDKALGMTGYTSEEVLHLSAEEMTHPDDQAELIPAVEELLRGERSTVSQEVRLVRRGGEPLWSHLTLGVVREADGSAKLLAGVVEDIREKKEARDALVQAHAELEKRVEERTGQLAAVNERLRAEVEERSRSEDALWLLTAKLEQSNRDLQDFAQVASHDLQEPLRIIRGFGDLLLHHGKTGLNNEARECVDEMQAAAQRMQTLINDLLSFARVGTRGQAFIPVDLNEMVEEVLLNLTLRVEETGGTVQVDPLPTLDADPSQLRQVFQNLIGNALKFHRPETPPRIHVSVLPPTPADGDEFVRIEVADNGIGFDEKHLDRIFKPFHRLHGRDEYEGTGMGLAICRRIVERHGGHLTAQSAPGKGAAFHLRLPLRRPDPLSDPMAENARSPRNEDPAAAP